MELIRFDHNSSIIRFVLKGADGQGLTGLTNASVGLIISTITDMEAAPTSYSVAGGKVETIATLGTYAAPTATKCRFKEVDAVNHPGLYEFQFADARFSVVDARTLIITVSGATDLVSADYQIKLVGYDPYRGGGFTVAPLQASNAFATLEPTNIKLYVSTALPHYVWPILDDSGAPYDLSGADLTLELKRSDGSIYLTLETADAGLIVGGDDDNEITEQRTAADVADRGSYSYEMRRTDAGFEQVLQYGMIEITDP